MQRKASGAEEETRGSRCNLTENKNTRKGRKKKAKAVVCAGRQEHILVAETGQHRAVLKVLQEQSLWVALEKRCLTLRSI